MRHLSERAAERYSIIFDWTSCADTIFRERAVELYGFISASFQNELSNCIVLSAYPQLLNCDVSQEQAVSVNLECNVSRYVDLDRFLV